MNDISTEFGLTVASIDYNAHLSPKGKKVLALFVVDYLEELKLNLNSSNVSKLEDLIKTSDILIDFSHGMLNTNIWIFVEDLWRYVYGYAILYKTILTWRKSSLESNLDEFLQKGGRLGQIKPITNKKTFSRIY